MPMLQHSVIIHADAAMLFFLTQNYERRLSWDPFLREARLLHGVTEPVVGGRAWCVSKTGMGMETEYVSYVPPRVAAVKMTRGPVFIEAFAGSWRFEPMAPNMTRVSFCYFLRSRPRWLRPLLDRLCLAVFARNTHRRLIALRSAAEKVARSS